MPSTLRLRSAYAANTLLLLLSLSATPAYAALNSMTYKGCFASSQPLKNEGSYTYQTSGYCQPICVKLNQAVLALSDGDLCWCGDEVPAANTKVDDSKCNVPCDGYNKQMCGGNGYYSVYLSGTEGDVPYYSGGSGTGSSSESASAQASSSPPSTASSSPSSKAPPPPPATTTTAAPSVVTEKSPGKTIIITRPASKHAKATSSASPTPSSSSSSGGGTNVAAVAAGVVVGVVAVIAIAAGVYFWIRHRRKKAAQGEYSRENRGSRFMRGGGGRGGGGAYGKPPPTGYSSTSDSRLDPEAGNKRNSQGSIADDQDFSRRILRVANPDRGSVT